MSSDRLRSIVPMFGGATNYVETLDTVLAFVAQSEPTTDDLVDWHRETFSRVSSRDSIMRRVEYLEDVGFLTVDDDRWRLGEAGESYLPDRDRATLIRIMIRRNVGLRSLLYALSETPLTIDEINRQQLRTHETLGWDSDNVDMAKQRVNWLRSLELVRRQGDRYELTDAGRYWIDKTVGEWEPIHSGGPATEYTTMAQTRSLDPEFRATVLDRYDTTCPISGVDHSGLLDVAHVLDWSDHPSHRADLDNVLALDKTHHAAFDRGLFTLDPEFRLRINPGFETGSRVLRQTLLDREGEPVLSEEPRPDPAYLARHNASLNWYDG